MASRPMLKYTPPKLSTGDTPVSPVESPTTLPPVSVTATSPVSSPSTTSAPPVAGTSIPIGGGTLKGDIPITGSLPDTWGDGSNPDQNVVSLIKKLRLGNTFTAAQGAGLSYDISKGAFFYNNQPINLIDGAPVIPTGGGAYPDTITIEQGENFGGTPTVSTDTPKDTGLFVDYAHDFHGNSNGVPLSGGSTTTTTNTTTEKSVESSSNNNMIYIVLGIIALIFVMEK